MPSQFDWLSCAASRYRYRPQRNSSHDNKTASMTRQTRRSQRLAAARTTSSVRPERKKPSGSTKPERTKNNVTAAGPSIEANPTLPSIAAEGSKPSSMPMRAGSNAQKKCHATTMHAARPRNASSGASLPLTWAAGTAASTRASEIGPAYNVKAPFLPTLCGEGKEFDETMTEERKSA